jgi:hypothetical protein
VVFVAAQNDLIVNCCEERMNANKGGKIFRWQKAKEMLPEVTLSGKCVVVGKNKKCVVYLKKKEKGELPIQAGGPLI